MQSFISSFHWGRHGYTFYECLKFENSNDFNNFYKYASQPNHNAEPLKLVLINSWRQNSILWEEQIADPPIAHTLENNDQR